MKKTVVVVLFAFLLLFSFSSCSNDVGITEVSSVTINQEDFLSVEVGKTIQFAATVLPADATDRTITWISSDAAIATVTSNGLLTAIKEGKVTITASASNGVKDEVTVSIVPASTEPGPDPKPEPEPSAGSELKEEGSLVEKTTKEKYLIESTINLLSADIMNVLANGEDVILDGKKLSNGVNVVKGTISVEDAGEIVARSLDSALNRKLRIEITQATGKEFKSVSLDYESNVVVENDEIVKVDPIATDARIDDVRVPDIDSDTFIPIALVFDKDMLSGLGKVMNQAAQHLEKLGAVIQNITLDVQDIGEVVINCEKSGLTPSGKGVLVFIIPGLDNQWHTLSSIGGQITIDGWANVEDTAIEDSNTPIVKDEEPTGHPDEFVASEFVPKFYALYYLSTFGKGGTSFEYSPEELVGLNVTAYAMFGENVTFDSYKVDVTTNVFDETQEITDDNPGIVKVDASTAEYGDVSMELHVYLRSNDIADAQVVRMEIGGENYSYLSYDILKSMLKVFGQFFYVDSLVYHIATSSVFELETADSYSHELNDVIGQLMVSGSVSVSNIVKNGNGQVGADFRFSGIELTDTYGGNNVDYTISGEGTFDAYIGQDEFEMHNIDIHSFSMLGLGPATDEELEAGNGYLNAIYIAPAETITIEMPESFHGTYTASMGEMESTVVISANDIVFNGISIYEDLAVTSCDYIEDAIDDGVPCQMVVIGIDPMGNSMTYKFALHNDGKLYLIAVGELEIARVELKRAL